MTSADRNNEWMGIDRDDRVKATREKMNITELKAEALPVYNATTT